MGGEKHTMVRAPVTLVAAVLLSVPSSREVPQQVIEGTVLAFDSNVSLIVANEQTDPDGLVVMLRDTRFERLEVLESGARVKVWFRGIGERRPLASRVRVLAE